MSIQGSARPSKFSEAALNADAPVPKVRVRKYDNNGTGSFTEVEVDRDSYAWRIAQTGTDQVWRPVPKTVRLKNPSGVVHTVPEDHHSVTVARTKKGKEAGWAVVGDDVQSEPRPEPEPAAVRWGVHPRSGRVVALVAGSFDAICCDERREGWRWASEYESARREELGGTYSATLDEKEM